MYIGPWQEYRLAQAFGGGRKAGPAPGKGRAGERLQTGSVRAEASAAAGVDRAALEGLLASLQAAPGKEMGSQMQILQRFMSEHAGQRPEPPELRDPVGKARSEERAKERRLVQARRERGPLKLQRLQRKREDFLRHLNNADSVGGASGETSSEAADAVSQRSETPVPAQNDDFAPWKPQATSRGGANDRSPAPARPRPSILPTRPSVLLDSFLPPGGEQLVLPPIDGGSPSRAGASAARSEGGSTKMPAIDARFLDASRGDAFEPLGPGHDELHVPFLGSSMPGSSLEMVDHMTRSPRDGSDLKVLGLGAVGEQNEQQAERIQLVVDLPTPRTAEQGNEAEEEGGEGSGNGLLLTSLGDEEDVDAMLNWSKGLGLGDDDVLFSDD